MSISLNKKNMTVKVAMLSLNKFPVLKPESILKDALDLMCKNKFGSVCVVDNKKKLIGIVTDGDIRRTLLKSQKPLSALMIEDLKVICTKKPKTVNSNHSLKKAVKLMQKTKIWDLPVTDRKKKLLGILHLHNALHHLN